MRNWPRTVLAAVCAVVLYAACVTAASARNEVTLAASFQPDHLGAQTTIVVKYHITSTDSRLPSPATSISLSMPAGLEGTTNLGLATCTPARLEYWGPSGCSPNARMGAGHALVAMPIGKTAIYENVTITAFMGEPADDHTTMLFYAEGITPVASYGIFAGTLLPAAGQYGEQLNTVIPLTTGIAEGPYVSLIRMKTEIGAQHLWYQRRVKHHTVFFKPEGPVLPQRCPPHGFPFSATVTFQDGTQVTAHTKVSCPTPYRSRRPIGPGHRRSLLDRSREQKRSLKRHRALAFVKPNRVRVSRYDANSEVRYAALA